MLEGLKQFNLPEIEEKVLKFWKEKKIFEKSLKNREGKKPFRFFEGPPTANGRPGLHHVLARAFKDIICRYKTMQGFFVGRRAGWDTHGLPVELEVEKKLGIKNKSEIEKFGIAEFNAQAKTSVWTYKSEWEKLTERIGFWLDFERPYVTYENSYVESLWNVFSEIAKKGFLKKLYKVVPWCPRCQTPLSSHELGQPGAYKLTKDPSVYVKFRLKGEGGRGKTKESLLVWTTTPWTLPANVAVAVNPALTYTKYKVGDEFLWSYSIPPVPGASADGVKAELSVVEKMSGKKLVGREYEPLYNISKSQNVDRSKYQVIPADFVSTEEGTGLVHIAPAFGEDDLRVIKEARSMKREAGDLNVPVTIDDRGIMNKGLPGAGRFIKQADDDIMADLEIRGLLYHKGTVEHEYPFCWRCSTPLIYFARFSWFFETSKLKEQFLASNEKINWIPSHIQQGRFGEWLKDLKDWSISRNRYWGTPIPIWECAQNEEHRLVVGSFEDLDKHAFNKNKFFMARHCEADHNVKNVVAYDDHGVQASKLTKKGMAQAGALGKALVKKGIDLIFVSPYARTKETAKIIARATGAKIVIDKRLAELNCGVFNGRNDNERKAYYASALEEFTKAPPGGESLNDARRRMMAALLEINSKYQGKNILIISHGHPLWVMSGAVEGLTSEQNVNFRYPKVGEYQEINLHNWPFDRDGLIDVHRPFIDEVVLKCKECGDKMKRIKDVADVWFDSGAMPFAQWHYPFENKKLIDKGEQFPADYIAEGMDQTRGWFYTMLAVSTLLGRGLAYKNVICLGLLLDKNGQKMSKSKGNVVDPWQMIQKYGSDVVRWYFYTVNPPGEPKRFDELDLGKTLRKIFMLAYNSFVFYDTYGHEEETLRPVRLAHGKQAHGKPNAILDQWITSRLHEVAEIATANLEKYEIGEAAKAIEAFVDDLSRWYIRRSRKNVSGKTLKIVLEGLAKLMAPFAPFFAEALWQSLITNNKKLITSVHLEDWFVVDKKLIDKKLLEAMAEVRRLASLGLAEREKAGIKVRQPLGKLKIKNENLKIKDGELLKILADEVNVKEVVIDIKLKDEVELDTEITLELREEGIMRELARAIQGLRHDAGYQPSDSVIVNLEIPAELAVIVGKNTQKLKRDVKAKIIELKKAQKFDVELSSKINEWPVWIAVRK
ncbi:MAG: class I tRNA ligase family protein [bacterium]|nr:class I tRNA ligase family protein [bacterium]